MDADPAVSFSHGLKRCLKREKLRARGRAFGFFLLYPAAVCMTLPSHRTHLVLQALLHTTPPHLRTDLK